MFARQRTDIPVRRLDIWLKLFLMKEEVGMHKSTKLDGPTLKNSESLRRTNVLNGWVEACTAEDAAVFIILLRKRPKLARTPLGMLLQSKAMRKIKGTQWQTVLFPKPLSIEDQRMIQGFRDACDRIELELLERENQEFERRAEASASFMTDVKRRKGDLEAAGSIIKRMFEPNNDPGAA